VLTLPTGRRAGLRVSWIEVEVAPAGDGWLARVQVGDPGAGRSFEVGVSRAELARFHPGAAEPSDLVRRSFEFLLEREPKESILGSFGLSTILRYYPEYEREIYRRS
jgi:hypothetical protein